MIEGAGAVIRSYFLEIFGAIFTSFKVQLLLEADQHHLFSCRKQNTAGKGYWGLNPC